MLLKSIFYVAIGSAIGGVGRFLLQQAIQKRIFTNFPYGTLVVNLIGCFLIGLIYGFATKENVLSPSARLFLATGICGGFTTFSSFMYENYVLIQSGATLNALIYTLGSIFVGYLATFLGVLCVK